MNRLSKVTSMLVCKLISVFPWLHMGLFSLFFFFFFFSPSILKNGFILFGVLCKTVLMLHEFWFTLCETERANVICPSDLARFPAASAVMRWKACRSSNVFFHTKQKLLVVQDPGKDLTFSWNVSSVSQTQAYK